MSLGEKKALFGAANRIAVGGKPADVDSAEIHKGAYLN